MQLLLTMQDENDDYPNVDWVRRHAKPLRVSRFGKSKELHLSYLRDMFYLVDPEVYAAFHKMLKTPLGVAGLTVDQDLVKQTAKHNAALLQRTTDLNRLFLWEGSPPHGCSLIMREVIADLLG
jgi:hypothetical protein